MSRALSSPTILRRYRLFNLSTTAATVITNTTHETVILARQSKAQRWIFGMIIGSAPFFIILFGWMFVSLCINNFVRFYQHRKNRYRQNIRTNRPGNISPNIDS
jgi:hypothetical protein